MPPFGIERINVRKTQPNPRIAFIRPMETTEQARAQEFLERLAASVVPIMKTHHLSIMALCDFLPNKEFLGRNFNGGERIDLILKSSSGAWLPFRFVQGVLIHELAHCVEMNHSKAFWKVRQTYHDELKELWAKRYTGEGIWGRGVGLESGEWAAGAAGEAGDLPEHLCGGAYRSRRKRGRKPTLSYKERKEKRIVEKFGVNGVALGADEFEKEVLERGRGSGAKPTVAGSKRGRELRAAAALRRFKVAEREAEEEKVVKEEVELESETESDYEEMGDEAKDEARDIDGSRLLDEKGGGVIKVCEDEDVDAQEARNEMAELQGFGIKKRKIPWKAQSQSKAKSSTSTTATTTSTAAKGNNANSKTASFADKVSPQQPILLADDDSTASEDDTVYPIITPAVQNIKTSKPSLPILVAESEATTPASSICTICSFVNEKGTPTCILCANVLDSSKVPGVWRCTSTTCKDSKYVNCVDVIACGVCGNRR